MPTSISTRTRTVSLGDLVAAVFDQVRRLTPPSLAGNVATRVVRKMLLRPGNARALAAMRAYTGAQPWTPQRLPS